MATGPATAGPASRQSSTAAIGFAGPPPLTSFSDAVAAAMSKAKSEAGVLPAAPKRAGVPTTFSLSPALNAAIAEIMPSTDPMDAPHFDTVDYINHLFPREQSLADVSKVLSALKAKLHRLDYEIMTSVREQSRVAAASAATASAASAAAAPRALTAPVAARGPTSALLAAHSRPGSAASLGGQPPREHLDVAKTSIQELFGKMADIKAKAEASEKMVEDLCSGIRSLDFAKTNLSTAVNTLKKLQDLTTSVAGLKELVSKRNFKEVAPRLQAINDYRLYFANYSSVPRVAELNAQMSAIIKQLLELFQSEFTPFVGAAVGIDSRPALPPHFADVCVVIDSMPAKDTKKFIKWFCAHELDDYRRSFRSFDENSRLEHVDKRLTWMKKTWKRYDDSWRAVFPPSWRLDQRLTEDFCFVTRENLVAELEKRQQMEVRALIRALTRSIEFEKEMVERWSHVSLSTGEEGKEDEEEEDVEALDPKSAKALKQRYRKMLREKAAAARLASGEREPEKSPGELSAEEAKERWMGILSSAFEDFMDLYIQEEDRNMAQVLAKKISEETWSTNETDRTKVLASSTDLIFYIETTLKRVFALNKKKTAFSLSSLFKKYLAEYSSILINKLPPLPADHIATPFRLNDAEEKLVLLIVNTAAYLLQTTESLQNSIKGKLHADFTEKVDFSSVVESFEEVSSRALRVLTLAMCGRLEPALVAMQRFPWATVEATGDCSDYVAIINQAVSAVTPQYQEFLSPVHYAFFCSQFVSEFSNVYLNSIYKCKRISETGCEQLGIDLATIKNILAEMPIGGASSRDGMRFKKFISKEFLRVENFLKVLNSIESSIVMNYKALIGMGTEADFTRMLDLKGLKKSEQTPLLDQFRQFSMTPKEEKAVFSRLLPSQQSMNIVMGKGLFDYSVNLGADMLSLTKGAFSMKDAAKGDK